MKFRYFTFILLLVICKILSFLATWIPFSFSTELYDIQSCSRVSPTASNPVKFFILFRAKFKITKFFSPFKFAILSIAFVHRFNFLQFTSTNNLKNICQQMPQESIQRAPGVHRRSVVVSGHPTMGSHFDDPH